MNKIVKLDQLKNIRKKFNNKKIILAHGVFDFFHHGHLQHLRKAKSYGDILVVSLTADKFILKGPGRPLYNQEIRVDFINHIDFVDFVTIVNFPSGVEVINKLKPDYYAKGVEYKNQNKDFTKAIISEKQALKSIGGQILYTNEPIMSSSNLINNFTLPKTAKEFLDKFKIKNSSFDIIKKFSLIKNKKVLVIGDAIFDEYISTSGLAKSPKEEIVSAKEENRKLYYGGIIATVQHISNFVFKPTLITVLANDLKLNKSLIKKLKNTSINYKLFFSKKKNIIKTRFLDENNKKLFQSNLVDFEDIENSVEKKILNYLYKNIKKYDLVIANDFGHGLLTKNIKSFLENKSKLLCLNVQTNSANFGYNFFYKYKKCNYLTMDEPEARLAVVDRFGNSNVIAKKIVKKINTNLVSITYGGNGTRVFKSNLTDKIVKIPAFSNKIVDTLGAGDAYFAISSLYYSVCKDPEIVGFIGNVAGALKTQYLGHEKSLNTSSVFPYIKSLLS